MADANQRLAQETDPKRLKQRLDRAKSRRQLIEPLIDECLRLYLPRRQGFYGTTPGEDRAADIYDETGTNAINEFSSRLHSGMTPNFTKWGRLEAGPGVRPQDRSAVNKDLEEITDYLFDEIWASNFSQEMNEAYLDAAISTGTLLVEEGKSQLLWNNAIPMTELFLEPGPHDEIGGMFRERSMPASFIEVLYPQAEISDELRKLIDREQDKPLTVVDAVWTDHKADGEAAFHAVFLPDHNCECIRKRRMTGQGSNPLIGFRFGKSAGEVWGRGPAMNTLPAVRTMNLTLELLLQNAAMVMVGMYHVDDDSIINADTITLEPGAVLPRLPGSRGLERIDTGPNRFDLQQILLEDQSLKIRKGLFNDMLSDPNKTPATALEVSERMADLANRMAAHFGRMHFELIQPYLMRAAYLAEKRGNIEWPKLNGEPISSRLVRATSPLAQAQGQRDIQNLTQYHQITTALFGPQAAMAQYDESELLPYLREKLSVPRTLFLGEKETGERIAALLAAQVAGVEQGGAPPGPIQNESRNA